MFDQLNILCKEHSSVAQTHQTRPNKAARDTHAQNAVDGGDSKTQCDTWTRQLRWKEPVQKEISAVTSTYNSKELREFAEFMHNFPSATAWELSSVLLTATAETQK